MSFHCRVCVGDGALGRWNTHAVTWLQHTHKTTWAAHMRAHSQPQRALVLTGSRPPLLSDRQDVGSTFISPRLWFLCRRSCLFSDMPLHSAMLLKYFPYDGACHRLKEERVRRLKRWAYSCTHTSTHPPPIHPLILPTFPLPSLCHAHHDLPSITPCSFPFPVSFLRRFSGSFLKQKGGFSMSHRFLCKDSQGNICF